MCFFVIHCTYFYLQLYLSVHTYGQKILYPWGFAKWKPPNYKELARVSGIAAKAVQQITGRRYESGNSAQLLYEAAGKDRLRFTSSQSPAKAALISVPSLGTNIFFPL